MPRTCWCRSVWGIGWTCSGALGTRYRLRSSGIETQRKWSRCMGKSWREDRRQEARTQNIGNLSSNICVAFLKLTYLNFWDLASGIQTSAMILTTSSFTAITQNFLASNSLNRRVFKLSRLCFLSYFNRKSSLQRSYKRNVQVCTYINTILLFWC